jgi:hypothetical protein
MPCPAPGASSIRHRRTATTGRGFVDVWRLSSDHGESPLTSGTYVAKRIFGDIIPLLHELLREPCPQHVDAIDFVLRQADATCCRRPANGRQTSPTGEAKGQRRRKTVASTRRFCLLHRTPGVPHRSRRIPQFCATPATLGSPFLEAGGSGVQQNDRGSAFCHC